MRLSLRTALPSFAVAGLWIAASAGAVPLTYGVVQNESDFAVTASMSAYMDVTPDLTELLPGGDDFPYFAVLSGGGSAEPSSSSYIEADTGLPSNFANGGNGITISGLYYQSLVVPGALTGFGGVSVPLDLTGGTFQLAGFDAVIADFSITLDAPFSSSLTPTGNPNEWLWAGLASVTLGGTLAPFVQVPTVDPITLGQFPFSQQVSIPLAGTFTASPSGGSRVTLGIPSGTLQDQSIATPVINVPLDLGGLGLVTGQFILSDLVLADMAVAAVFDNITPIPEPNTGALVALGLVAIAVRRGRR